MADLDRLDTDDRYMGDCSACGESVYVDPLLGEREHRVGRDLVCTECYREYEERMQEWATDYDWSQDV